MTVYDNFLWVRRSAAHARGHRQGDMDMDMDTWHMDIDLPFIAHEILCQMKPKCSNSLHRYGRKYIAPAKFRWPWSA